MTISYVDTSAAMKLLVEEAESDALLEYLIGDGSLRLVSSWLLHTELHCAAGRRGWSDPKALAAVLGTVDLVDLTRGDLLAAGTHAPLRANDAIHLAVALRIGADELIAYDLELAASATRAGLKVVSPN